MTSTYTNSAYYLLSNYCAFLSNRKVIILLLTRKENQDVVKVRWENSAKKVPHFWSVYYRLHYDRKFSEYCGVSIIKHSVEKIAFLTNLFWDIKRYIYQFLIYFFCSWNCLHFSHSLYFVRCKVEKSKQLLAFDNNKAFWTCQIHIFDA